MFSKPTAFVLGAGVSVPFGFPSGVGLVDAICTNTQGRQDRLIELLELANDELSTSYIKEFIEGLRGSGLYSIDAWLEGNPQYMKLGKCAIAAIIWEAEHQAITRVADDSDNWFRWLWNQMYHPIIGELAHNKVNFITFNYDRLLEHKLLQSIRFTYMQSSAEEKRQAFQAILEKIIHVHGHLQTHDREYSFIGIDSWKGAFKLTDNELLANKVELANRISYLAKSINIVCENPGDDAAVNTAKQWLLDAKKRVFLGFGYDKRNLQRLGVKQIVASPDIPHASGGEYDIVAHPLVGTAYRLELGERLTAKDIFSHKIHFGEDDFNAVRFCRKYVQVS